MSYQVLARKWRPQTFQQVIGQPHVLTALENGLNQNRVHHAYLFSGTRGVGKTTIARLLAKSLNCEMGVTSTPCGQCANCQAIDQGRFVDLLEVDAASRTKVDDTRELLDNVQYKPAQGRYKVYLIDEVHMLSKSSFNALLKTLEEPPEYVKFLLATTDPQKLPITVLSRCLQFHLKAILPEQIEHQLATILPQENATFEQAALNVIAKAADGSMRDALSLTDQALAFGAGHIEYAAVLKMLGTIDQSHLHYLLHFIASGNSQKVFEKIQEFVYLGADFSALHQELASLCHQIALMQLQLNANVTEKTAVQLLAERLTPEEVQLFYQIAVQGYKDYHYAPNGKVALEMTVMRLLAFKPANYIDIDEAMLVQADQAESIIAPITTPTPTSITTAATVESVASPIQVETPDDSLPIENKVQQEIVQMNEPVVNGSVVNEPIVNEPIVIAETVIEARDQQNHLPYAETQQQDAMQSEVIVPVIAAEETQITAPILPVQLNTAETVTSSASSLTSSAPILTSSNSRNMLRSHRLKREALKKSEATTQQTSIIDEKLVAATTKVEMGRTAEERVSSTIQSKPVVKAPEKQHYQQELPPLSSYQEQPIQQDYTEHHHDVMSQPVDTSETTRYTANHAPSTQQNTTQPEAEKAVDTVAHVKAYKANHDISNINQSSTEVVLIENAGFDRVAIDIANYVDDKMTDKWFLAIKSMQLVGFEKLLAKSSVMQQREGNIVLTLHNTQQHLLKNQPLCETLKAKLRQFYGQEYKVDIEAGQVIGHHTPMELEQVVYQQYLDNAKVSIKSDPIVQIFVQDYAAKVYENSVVPL